MSSEISLGPFAAAEREIPPAVAALPKGDVLLPYQGRASQLMATSQLLVVEKSRRIGLTWGMAAQAVLTAATSRAAGGMNVYYMGYEKEMTREFVEVCAMWAKAFQLAASAIEEEVIQDAEGDIQVFRMRLSSGFSIVALPSVARALRGKQGLVLIDEAAFITDLAEVLKAALALLMWGGRVVVVSTHNGTDNPFNLLLEDIRTGKRGGEPLRITFRDALADGLYERICLVKGETATTEGREAWEASIRARYGEAAAEELDCIPSSGGGSWLDLALITAAEHPEAGLPECYGGGVSYGGWDVARRHDGSIQIAAEKVARCLWVREDVIMRNVRFAEQHDNFERLHKDYRIARSRIDQTGMGEAVVEEAQRRLGESRVQGVLLTAPARLRLATILKDHFEAGTIRIPANRPDVRADLRSLKRVTGPNKTLSLREGDVHPDWFWALALAVEAAETGYQPYDYQPVRRQAGDGFWRPAAGRDDPPPPPRSLY